MDDEIVRRPVEEGSSTPTSKCTFSSVEVFAVKIRGEGGGDGKIPDDDGLVSKFLRWQLDANVYSLQMGAGHSGGGSYLGFFTGTDAEKIETWLLANGVLRDDDKTWERR